MENNTVNMKEYLKKYLSGGDKKKKKKKKKEPAQSHIIKSKIVDDDLDLKNMKPVNDEELEIFDFGEDAPQIAGIIDDRPEEIRVMSEYRSTKKWKIVADEYGIEEVKVTAIAHDKGDARTLKEAKNVENSEKKNSDSDESPPRKAPKNNPLSNSRQKADSDSSPPRAEHIARMRIKQEKDASPPRRRDNKSDSDASPPRRSRRKDSDSDASPPRRSRRKDSDSDASPPRKNKRKGSDSDAFLPRRSRRKGSDSDASPPRKNKRKGSDSDAFLPRRGRRKNPDASPHRKSQRKASDSDASPPRRRPKRKDELSNASPPRRRGNVERGREGKNSHQPRERCTESRRKSLSPKVLKEASKKPEKNENYGLILSKNHGNDSEKEKKSSQLEKTLSGKKSGLQSAADMKKESDMLRRKEKEMFSKMSDEMTGRHAEAIVRKNGRRRDPKEEARLRREKEEKEAEKIAQYAVWGKGVKQVQDRQDKIQDELYEMSKPLARYRDDKDLDEMLRNQEREGDPMLEYIRRKRKEESGPAKPEYQGIYLPNRYNIKPGHKWDGVDRSNGYEKRWFEEQNAKKAREEEAFKWSTEDM